MVDMYTHVSDRLFSLAFSAFHLRKGTPDDWVPRHPELVRLTGRHPFNVEPPVWRIKDHGFISPNELHYVRNHGAVPRITDGDKHTVRVLCVCVCVSFSCVLVSLAAGVTKKKNLSESNSVQQLSCAARNVANVAVGSRWAWS